MPRNRGSALFVINSECKLFKGPHQDLWPPGQIYIEWLVGASIIPKYLI